MSATARPRPASGLPHTTTNEHVKDMEGGTSNILVAVRLRPLSAQEKEQGHREVIRMLDRKVVVLLDPQSSTTPTRSSRTRERRYAFDYAFDRDTTQMELYNATSRFLLDGVLDGFNATVFAYGATGAGKTHTMLGYDGDPGIIYLMIEDLFKEMVLVEKQHKFSVLISYLEVYNENIRDLLNPSSDFLDLREDPDKGICVAGITEIVVESVDEVMEYVRVGSKYRTQEPTAANEVSSRSHAVMQITVQQKDKTPGTVDTVKIGKLSMIDLAGSERAAATQNRGIRMLEGASINRSLLALGNCINALGDKRNASSNKFVNYRDSKLTRLLKDSLGGNCRTVMIANISPSNMCFEETHNTLKYANRAKNIKTKVTRNVLNVSYHIAQYTQIISELRDEVARLKSTLASAGIDDETVLKPKHDINAFLGNDENRVPLAAEVRERERRDSRDAAEKREMRRVRHELLRNFHGRMRIRKELMDVEDHLQSTDNDIKRHRLAISEWVRDHANVTEEEALRDPLVMARKAELAKLEATERVHVAERAKHLEHLRDNEEESRRLRRDLPSRIRSKERRAFVEMEYKMHVVELANVELKQNSDLQMRIMERKDLELQRLHVHLQLRDAAGVPDPPPIVLERKLTAPAPLDTTAAHETAPGAGSDVPLDDLLESMMAESPELETAHHLVECQVCKGLEAEDSVYTSSYSASASLHISLDASEDEGRSLVSPYASPYADFSPYGSPDASDTTVPLDRATIDRSNGLLDRRAPGEDARARERADRDDKTLPWSAPTIERPRSSRRRTSPRSVPRSRSSPPSGHGGERSARNAGIPYSTARATRAAAEPVARAERSRRSPRDEGSTDSAFRNSLRGSKEASSPPISIPKRSVSAVSIRTPAERRTSSSRPAWNSSTNVKRDTSLRQPRRRASGGRPRGGVYTPPLSSGPVPSYASPPAWAGTSSRPARGSGSGGGKGGGLPASGRSPPVGRSPPTCSSSRSPPSASSGRSASRSPPSAMLAPSVGPVRGGAVAGGQEGDATRPGLAPRVAHDACEGEATSSPPPSSSEEDVEGVASSSARIGGSPPPAPLLAPAVSTAPPPATAAPAVATALSAPGLAGASGPRAEPAPEGPLRSSEDGLPTNDEMYDLGSVDLDDATLLDSVDLLDGVDLIGVDGVGLDGLGGEVDVPIHVDVGSQSVDSLEGMFLTDPLQGAAATGGIAVPSGPDLYRLELDGEVAGEEEVEEKEQDNTPPVAAASQSPATAPSMSIDHLVDAIFGTPTTQHGGESTVPPPSSAPVDSSVLADPANLRGVGDVYPSGGGAAMGGDFARPAMMHNQVGTGEPPSLLPSLQHDGGLDQHEALSSSEEAQEAEPHDSSSVSISLSSADDDDDDVPSSGELQFSSDDE